MGSDKLITTDMEHVQIGIIVCVGIETLNSLALINIDIMKENTMTLSNSSPVG